MLSRAAFVACAVMLVVSMASAPAAGDTPNCPPDREWCSISVTRPGSEGSSNGGQPAGSGSTGGATLCVIDVTGWIVPCHDDIWGWFSNVDDCYYRVRDPQPPAEESVWAGHYPDGAIYMVTCLAPLPGSNIGWTWLPSPPPGFGAPAVTPAELAQEAVDQMQLVGPAIRTTGAPGEPYVVGVPLWLWTEVSPVTWGPNSATASVPGLSVTATAQAARIEWDMGDGNGVTCASPGTVYYVGAPKESPTCDYTYERSSAGQPGDAWTITATTTWEVAWRGGGTSGVLTVTRTSRTSLQVGEVQVLTSA